MPMLEGQVDTVIGVDTPATAMPRPCWMPTAGCGSPWRCQATGPVMPGCSGWPRSRQQVAGCGPWKAPAAMGPG